MTASRSTGGTTNGRPEALLFDYELRPQHISSVSVSSGLVVVALLAYSYPSTSILLVGSSSQHALQLHACSYSARYA